MYILSINISHDTSTCLIHDGNILFYSEEERFSKIKHHQINGHAYFSDVFGFLYYQIPNIKKYTKYIDYIIFSSYGSYYDEKYISYISNVLKFNQIVFNQIIFDEHEHHLYHASSAAFSSGFEECACLIIDGSGAKNQKLKENSPVMCYDLFREIESIYSFTYEQGFLKKFKHYGLFNIQRKNSLKKDLSDGYETIFSSSIGCGNLFTIFSDFLGFKGGQDAGKIMGLSSYGVSSLNVDLFTSIEDVYITDYDVLNPLINEIEHFSLEKQQNILKDLQENTKKHTIRLIEKSLNVCKTNNIVLSGGYFLNCVNNYHYLKHFPDVNFYVDPIAHDGGTAIGAAKHLWYSLTKDQTIRKLDTLYLG